MTDERNDADEPQDDVVSEEDVDERAEGDLERDDEGEDEGIEGEEVADEGGEDEPLAEEPEEDDAPDPTKKPDDREPKERRRKEGKKSSQAGGERRKRRRRRKEQPEQEVSEDAEEQSFWERGLGKRLEGIVPDVVKRTLVGSLGSMFLSEDGLRQSLAELRLPKEIVTFILQQADHTKREFMRIVANEMRDFLESTNFYDEMRKILTSLSFEIRTEVRLIPNDSAFVKPEVKNTVRVKRDGKDVSEPVEEES